MRYDQSKLRFWSFFATSNRAMSIKFLCLLQPVWTWKHYFYYSLRHRGCFSDVFQLIWSIRWPKKNFKRLFDLRHGRSILTFFKRVIRGKISTLKKKYLANIFFKCKIFGPKRHLTNFFFVKVWKIKKLGQGLKSDREAPNNPHVIAVKYERQISSHFFVWHWYFLKFRKKPRKSRVNIFPDFFEKNLKISNFHNFFLRIFFSKRSISNGC